MPSTSADEPGPDTGSATGPASTTGAVPPAPTTVRRAGLLVLLEGVAALVFALTIALATVSDPQAPGRIGYGVAGYFGLVGVAVVVAGLALLRSRKAARAPSIVLQILLLGAAWYLLVGSGQAVAGLALGAVAVVVLVLLVGRATNDWVAAQYRPPMQG